MRYLSLLKTSIVFFILGVAILVPDYLIEGLLLQRHAGVISGFALLLIVSGTALYLISGIERLFEYMIETNDKNKP